MMCHFRRQRRDNRNASFVLPDLVKTTHHHGNKHRLASSTTLLNRTISAARQAGEDALEEWMLGLPRETHTVRRRCVYRLHRGRVETPLPRPRSCWL